MRRLRGQFAAALKRVIQHLCIGQYRVHDAGFKRDLRGEGFGPASTFPPRVRDDNRGSSRPRRSFRRQPRLAKGRAKRAPLPA